MIARTILFFAALTLISCSYKGDYEYYLKNQSTHDLDLVYVLQSITDTVHVTPGENTLIRYIQGDDGLEDKKEDFLSSQGFTQIYFLPLVDSQYVLKNPKDRDSWTYSTEAYGNSSKAGTNIYTLTIKNEDIGQ